MTDGDPGAIPPRPPVPPATDQPTLPLPAQPHPPVEHERRGPVGKIVLGAVGLVVLVALVFGGVFVFSAIGVKNELTEAAGIAQTLGDQLQNDPGAASATMVALSDKLDDASRAIDGAGFSGGAALPWVGPNVVAARTATTAMQTLVADTLPTVVTVAQSVDLEKGTLRGGPSSLGSLMGVVPRLPDALKGMDSAETALNGIDTGSLLPPVADAIEQLRTLIAGWQKQVAPLHKIVDAITGATQAAGDGVEKLQEALGRLFGD